MEGIHIVAFAEEDDPGRRPFSSLCGSPSFKKVYFHVCFLQCKHLFVLAGVPARTQILDRNG